MGRDYCYDPMEHPHALRLFDEDCTEEEPCGKCQGVRAFRIVRLHPSFQQSSGMFSIFSFLFPLRLLLLRRTATTMLSVKELSSAFNVGVEAMKPFLVAMVLDIR